MIKKVLKLMLCVIVHTIVIIVLGAVLPHTQEFKEASISENPNSLWLLLLYGFFICFTLYFIYKNSDYNGLKQYINMVLAVFFAVSFMTQIETIFFISAFPKLKLMDVISFMIRDLLSVMITAALLAKLFLKEKVIKPVASYEKRDTGIKTVVNKLGIIGIVYTFIYMVFGYFIAWQFQELRVFYSGTAEKLSFFGKLFENIKTNPVIYPFQFVRGIMFAAFILPLLFMINNRKNFIISVCLVYINTAALLLIPNFLFPDMVRYGHLLEMATSMTVFGFIVGNILWNKRCKHL